MRSSYAFPRRGYFSRVLGPSVAKAEVKSQLPVSSLEHDAVTGILVDQEELLPLALSNQNILW